MVKKPRQQACVYWFRGTVFYLRAAGLAEQHGLWLGDNTFLGWVIFAFDNVIFVLKQRPSQLEDVNLEMKGKSIFFTQP